MIESTGCAMCATTVGVVFDDVSTKFLGDAFDAVFVMLHGAQYPDHVREVIADRVLEFGQATDRTRSAAAGTRGRRQPRH